MLHSNLGINAKGHLTLCGADTVELAKKYGTPLYLLDEDRIRERCRLYRTVMKEAFTPGSRPLYAGKALAIPGLYRICKEEGMSADVVSPGELFIALKGGIDPENLYFHGNAKTDGDVRFAVEKGVGYFVADNLTELQKIDRAAGEKGVTQKVLLRLTPGIDPHTFAAVTTGKVDSKFGAAIETGQAEELFRFAVGCKNIDVAGVHCHIGSQIFEAGPFCDAAEIMLSFLFSLREKYGYTARLLNLGGGIGIRYTEEDPVIDIRETLTLVGERIKKLCAAASYPVPDILTEPGRSIVADAGVTLYTVQNVKTIPGFKSYVATDGGMADNPRYALYRSRYTALIADRAGETPDFRCSIAGRCCESGDLIGEDMPIQTPKAGDVLAVLVTGAYNYSMSSNYNALQKPPVVMISEGIDRLSVRRETFDDLTRCSLE